MNSCPVKFPFFIRHGEIFLINKYSSVLLTQNWLNTFILSLFIRDFCYKLKSLWWSPGKFNHACPQFVYLPEIGDCALVRQILISWATLRNGCTWCVTENTICCEINDARTQSNPVADHIYVWLFKFPGALTCVLVRARDAPSPNTGKSGMESLIKLNRNAARHTFALFCSFTFVRCLLWSFCFPSALLCTQRVCKIESHAVAGQPQSLLES